MDFQDKFFNKITVIKVNGDLKVSLRTKVEFA